METTTTKVICQQLGEGPEAGILLEQSSNIQKISQESSSFIIDDIGDKKGISGTLLDKQDIEKHDQTAGNAETSELKKQYGGILVEEIPDDSITKSSSIQEINNKLSAGVLIEEPTSDTDLDEQSITRKDNLQVSRGVSIVSIPSDDEGGSQKASLSQGLGTEEASAVSAPQPLIPSVDESKSPQKGKLLELSTSESKTEPDSQKPVSDSNELPQKGKIAEKETANEMENKPKDAKVSTAAKKPKKGLKIESGAEAEVDSVSKAKTPVEEQVPQITPHKGKKSVDEGQNEDPEVEALLKRVQKQRSVLEEILDKEEERKVEGKR